MGAALWLAVSAGTPRLSDLLVAIMLAVFAAGTCVRADRWSRFLSANLADVPTIAAILLLEPGLAGLVAALGIVVYRGRFGLFSRALNVTLLALPVLVSGLLFHWLLATFEMVSVQQGPLAWLLFALVAIGANSAIHWTLASAWFSRLEGKAFADYVRDVALPVAKSDPAPAVLTILLVELMLLLPAEAKLVPLFLGGAVGVGLWTFMRSAKDQVAARELKDDFFRAIFVSLARLLEMKDPDTAVHSARVARYSSEIAAVVGLSEEEQSRIHLAGLLHDVGKVGVPDWILLKPGRLSDPERAAMQRHSRFSAEAIAGIPGFGDLTRMVYAHHERLDGSGYPEGIGGKDVPFGARIIGVADTFEALTSDRPYRPGRTPREALAVIEDEIHLFDPDVVAGLRELVMSGTLRSDKGASVADFAAEWSKAARVLDVRPDDEPFVIPPEKYDPLLDLLVAPDADTTEVPDTQQ